MRLEVVNPRVKYLCLLYPNVARASGGWRGGFHPGDFVRDLKDSRFFGTVVAVKKDGSVLVLWSYDMRTPFDPTLDAQARRFLKQRQP